MPLADDKKQNQALARKLAAILTCDPTYPGVIGAHASGGLVYLTHGAGGKVFADMLPTEAEDVIRLSARRLQQVINTCS